MNELAAVRKEISRLEIGADDPIVESGQLASNTAHALYTVASITSTHDRRFAAAIVEAADEIEAIGALYDWHGTPNQRSRSGVSTVPSSSVLSRVSARRLQPTSSG